MLIFNSKLSSFYWPERVLIKTKTFFDQKFSKMLFFCQTGLLLCKQYVKVFGLFPIAKNFQMWPNFAKFCHFCHILKAFGYFRSLHLALGISLSLLWHVFDAIGQIFIDISGQIFTNNLAIWSHCQYFVSIRLLLFLWVLDRILQI